MITKLEKIDILHVIFRFRHEMQFLLIQNYYINFCRAQPIEPSTVPSLLFRLSDSGNDQNYQNGGHKPAFGRLGGVTQGVS